MSSPPYEKGHRQTAVSIPLIIGILILITFLTVAGFGMLRTARIPEPEISDLIYRETTFRFLLRRPNSRGPDTYVLTDGEGCVYEIHQGDGLRYYEFTRDFQPGTPIILYYSEDYSWPFLFGPKRLTREIWSIERADGRAFYLDMGYVRDMRLQDIQERYDISILSFLLAGLFLAALILYLWTSLRTEKHQRLFRDRSAPDPQSRRHPYDRE